MSCCCGSEKKNSKSGRGRASEAPSRQSMKDRENMNDGERAMEPWWDRQSWDEDDHMNAATVNATPHGESAPSGSNPLTSSFEQSTSRIEQRNPLHRPYDLQSREAPSKAMNGSVMPPKSTVQAGSQQIPPPPPTMNEDTDPSIMEIFRPQVSVPGTKMAPIPLGETSDSIDRRQIYEDGWRLRGSGYESSERITAIEPAGSQEFLDDHPRSRPQRDPPPAKQYSQKASFTLADYDKNRRGNADPVAHKNGGQRSSTRSKRDGGFLGSIPQLKRQNKKSTTKRPDDSNNDDDRLSDVPSDVDSVTKERYILACQMLKNTLTMREKSMEPLEREFILSLIGDYESVVDEGSIINHEQVSAVEHAQLHLENDPLFQNSDGLDGVTDKGRDKVPPPSPMSAATRQIRESASISQAGQGPSLKERGARLLQEVASKVPNAATLAKPKGTKPFIANPCNPRSADNVAPADIVLLVREEDDDDNHFYGDDSDSNQQPDGSENEANQIVRFDGWSNHKSAEYPFRILGADDPCLQPRVLTPPIMEALRGFFPFVVSESNFWLKFSLVREGASLETLLSTIRTSTHTIIGVETNDGEVFGSFTGTPWRTGTRWFGTGEAFLWRLKKSRLTSAKNAKRSNFENEMEVYPYTGYDDLVQYCTAKTIAVGGGDWIIDTPCPFQDEPRGIGFMIDGDLAGGETNSCATFANPRLCRATSASNEFAISNLEVWTLTPCLNVKDAAKMEVQKLFIESNYR